MTRGHVALPFALLMGCAALALGIAAPARANGFTPRYDSGALTLTADGAAATLSIAQNGSQVLVTTYGSTITWGGANPSYPAVTSLVIDMNHHNGVVATLDGAGGNPIVQSSIRVINARSEPINPDPLAPPYVKPLLKLKGAIGGPTTATLQLQAPIELLAATTLTADPAGGLIGTSRGIDGAYPLTVSTLSWEVAGGIGATTAPTSLDVTAGTVQAQGLLAASGTQTWHGATELDLANADVTLRATRVTHEGSVGCASCAATRSLTFDVSEVKAGAAPGSTVRDLGGQTDAPVEWAYRIIKAGAGTLSFGGGALRNAYSGGTQVDDGTLVVDVARSLASGPVVVASNGTLQMNANITQPAAFQVDGALDLGAQDLTLYVDSLSGSGAIRCALSSCGDLTVMTTDASGATAFGGSFGGDGTGTLGHFGLVKAGEGLLVLSGISHHHGTTEVAAGVLRVTGTIGSGLSVGSVTVASGARLTGWGDVGGDAFGGGMGISAAGTIDLTGLAQPETMSTAALSLNGGTLEMAAASASSYSRLWVANYVMLAADPTLRVTAGAGLADGDVLTIIRKTSAEAVTGTFAGLPEGAIVTPASGAGTFRISYVGGDGNDITLTYIAPPVQPAAVTAPARTSATSSAPAIRTAKPAIDATGTMTTRVTVAGPGAISQTAVIAGGARAKTDAFCSAKLVVKRAGTYRLKCTPSKAMRARLRTGALRLRVTTTFAPKSGSATSSTAVVTVPRRR